MESIQRMVLPNSPLVALAQQRVEVAGNIVAAAKNQWAELFGGNRSNNWAKRAQSKAAASASGNRHLADNDVRRRIMQNHRQ
jgi:hypothetical protein